MNEEKSIRFVMLVSPDEKRRANALKIKERIPELELVYADIRTEDLFQKHLDALITNPDKYKGVVMMEDDILLSRNFEHLFEKAVSEHGDGIIQFFERAMAKRPLSRGYQNGAQFYSCVCYYMPAQFTQVICSKSWVTRFKEWFAKKNEPWTYPIDTYISYVLGNTRMIYWREIPYIVQHLDFKSMMGNRSTKRQSKYFIDDLEAQNAE